MKTSALRRWLREERGRENAEALAAGVEVGFGGDARAVAALRRMVVPSSRVDWARRVYPNAELEIDGGGGSQ